MGTDMKKDSIGSEPPIELDPRELLGLRQVAKVSGKLAATSRLLSKVGAEGPPPPPVAPLLSRTPEQDRRRSATATIGYSS